jgi:lysozyme family protein
LILCIVGQYCMTVFALCVDWQIGICCFRLEQKNSITYCMMNSNEVNLFSLSTFTTLAHF